MTPSNRGIRDLRGENYYLNRCFVVRYIFRITMGDIFNSQQNEVRLIDEWNKCNFCKNYDTYDGCEEWECNFKVWQDKVIETAKEKDISCSDVLALIER